MSLILEALRKSEAERRRGQSPQLFDPPATAAPVAPERPARALWWALPVVLSAVLLVSWRYATAPQRADDAPAVDGAGGAAVPADDAPVASQATGSSLRADVDPAGSGRVFDPADPVSPAAPGPAALRGASGAVARPAQSAVIATQPDSAGTGPTQPVAAPIGRATAAPFTAADLPAPASPRQSTAASASPAPPRTPDMPRTVGTSPARTLRARATSPAPAAAPSPATATATATTQSAPYATAEPLRLADLTPAERRALPALKMSMHLWSPDAAQRFVILDGMRMGEGDRIGEAVVAEITGDGAILAWGGRRVKVTVR